MDTKTLRFWKEYKQEIDDYNAPLVKKAIDINKKQWERWKKEDAAADLRDKKRQQYIQKKFQEQIDWDNLPFYKKIGRIPPDDFSSLQVPLVFHPPMLMMFFIPTKRASWEDFLDWLAKKKLGTKEEQNIKEMAIQ